MSEGSEDLSFEKFVKKSVEGIPPETAEEAAKILTERITPDKILSILIGKSSKYGTSKDINTPQGWQEEITPTKDGKILAEQLSKAIGSSEIILGAVLSRTDELRSDNSGPIDYSWDNWSKKLNGSIGGDLKTIIDEFENAKNSSSLAPDISGFDIVYKNSPALKILALAGTALGDNFSCDNLNFNHNFESQAHPAIAAIVTIRQSQNLASLTDFTSINTDLGITKGFGRSK